MPMPTTFTTQASPDCNRPSVRCRELGDQTIYFPKLDWQVNGKNHVSVEANRMRWTSPAGIQTAPAVAYGLSSFGNDYVRDTWIVG